MRNLDLKQTRKKMTDFFIKNYSLAFISIIPNFTYAAPVALDLPKAKEVTSVQKTNVEPKFIQSAPIIPGSSIQAYQYLLENGLKFIVIPDNRNPIATIQFILDAGSNREQKGITGLAHFFEHMMFRKTKDHPEGYYDRTINSVGGSGNAGTSDSFVTFYTTFPGPALETMLKLEADRFTKLDLAEPYFSIEKGAVISERKLRVENDPLQRSNEFIRSITERGTSMEWLTIGSKKDVEEMSINAAKSFYEKYYTPDNTIMIVGGPFEQKNVAQMVQKYFSSWQGKVTEQHAKYPADYYTRDLGKKFICSAPIFNKRFKIVYPAANGNLKELIYSIVFQAMLDDNPNGTFERRLVKDKLVTDFNFYKTYWQKQNNPFVVNFSLTKEQKYEPVLQFWQKGVQEVLNKPISEKIRRQILKQLAVSNADTAERMTALTNTVLDNTFFLNDFNASGQAEKIVKSITTENLRQWIHENISPQKYYLTGIVTPQEAPTCSDMYAEFQKSIR
ncbi:M16 family metallopeptidase [Fluviispira vulneris]|uniref:M16 family metallopeptidase n=1 Tax=Fluviispira vulneris TaxID=2763012 RepID=UPI00164837D7|nr:pitrilysin family protein [Fluviispira vulneris]